VLELGLGVRHVLARGAVIEDPGAVLLRGVVDLALEGDGLLAHLLGVAVDRVVLLHAHLDLLGRLLAAFADALSEVVGFQDAVALDAVDALHDLLAAAQDLGLLEGFDTDRVLGLFRLLGLLGRLGHLLGRLDGIERVRLIRF
jgi:hypothetical protein